MKIKIDDIITHKAYEKDIPEGSTPEDVFKLLDYKKYDLFQLINDRHSAPDEVLKEGDKLTIIAVPGGG
jgi:hypothetical protein